MGGALVKVVANFFNGFPVQKGFLIRQWVHG